MLSIWRPGARTRRYRRWRKRSRARPVTTLYSDPRHSLRSHVILGLDTGHGTQWSSSIVRHRWEQNREVISQYIRFPVLVTHLPCSGAPFPRGWGAWVRFPGVGGRPPPATYLQSALMYFHGILAVDLLGGKVMHYNLESHQSKPILFAGDVPKIACTFPSLAVWLLATTSWCGPWSPWHLWTSSICPRFLTPGQRPPPSLASRARSPRMTSGPTATSGSSSSASRAWNMSTAILVFYIFIFLNKPGQLVPTSFWKAKVRW